MAGIDRMREVYGIRRVSFDEAQRTVRVEYDATRLTDEIVASLLRNAGIDLKERIALV
jgi:copper chaperone CopZ